MLDPRAPGVNSRVIVLGAGIAGLSAANRLNERGLHVTVIDHGDRCSGAHRSQHIGDFTFDLGSFFYEEGARIFELAPHIRELCPKILRVQRRIGPTGTILHYPLDPRETLRQASWRLPGALLDLAHSRLIVRRNGTLEAISRQRLGRTFFEMTGLEAYMTRFHHLSPREIDEAFFFHRMAHIERSTRAGALLRAGFRSLSRQGSTNGARALLRVRPRDGFESLFEPIAARLKSRGVEFRFLESLERVRRDGPSYHVRTTKGSYFADAVVSTLPLDALHQALFDQKSGLVSLDMATLFVSAEWLDPNAGNVLFNFHGKGEWKRATIYSRIYPAAIGREFFTVEATIAPGASYDPHLSFDDFRSHAMGLGLARGLTLEGYARVEDCYPLYSPGSSARLGEILNGISATGVILAGRQGRFEYLPTSTGVIKRVEEELKAAGLLARAPEPAA